MRNNTISNSENERKRIMLIIRCSPYDNIDIDIQFS